jgi:hypothetical protein
MHVGARSRGIGALFKRQRAWPALGGYRLLTLLLRAPHVSTPLGIDGIAFPKNAPRASAVSRTPPFTSTAFSTSPWA